VFTGALATQIWLAAGSSAAAWLRVVSLGTSGLILALIGSFLVQTLHCSRLHASGNRAGARLLREQLAPSGRAALAAAFLLAIVNLIPYLIPPIPERSPIPPSGRRAPLPVQPDLPEATAPVTEGPLPTSELAELPATPHPPPPLPPLPEGLPVRLTMEEPEALQLNPTWVSLPGGLPQVPQEQAVDDTREGFPRYRPDLQDGFPYSFESVTLSFARMGAPREGHPEEWLPPEMRLEVTFLRGHGRGTEIAFLLDVPIGPDDSISASVGMARLDEAEFLEGSTGDYWQRVVIAYTRRLAGHTRQAGFDLSVSIGISADRYRMEGPDGPSSPGPRLSPYVAVDATLWQQTAAGLFLHAGYSFPINLTGASSGVLDLSATMRIDLTESISIHAGYRYLILRLQEYEEVFLGPEASPAVTERYSGPIVGIDIRF
jgi:hypothetical protein